MLRGIGGERAFHDRYRARSQQVRHAGVRVAVPQSTLDAAQVLLPGIFVVFVTWLSARFALSGRIGTGDLVAFYGYAAFLVIPLRTAAEAVDKITRSHVGAQRMVDVLVVQRHVLEPATPAAEPPEDVPLVDQRSGLVVEPGLLTCVVSAVPDESAAIADRLGRFGDDGGVTLGGVPLEQLPVEVVRRRIVVSEPDPLLFSGTLRSELDPWATASDDEILAAISVANAEDVLDAAPAGLATRDRRAGPLVLGRPAPATRARARSAVGGGGARPRRADERRRRAHRGPDRASAARAAGRAARPWSCRRARSCSTRPIASRSCAAAASSPSARTASCSARARTTARPSPRGEEA